MADRWMDKDKSVIPSAGSAELKIPLKKLSACAKPPHLLLPSGIPSHYFIPPHAHPPPIPSHPMHALPLFHGTPCMPSPYSIPRMHTLPLFYPTSCMPSPYSIPFHACPPPILSQPMQTLPLFCAILSSPCHPHILSQPMHAILSHTSWRHIYPVTSDSWVCHFLNLLTLTCHHLPSLPSFLIWSINLCINLWYLNVCCFLSHELTTSPHIYHIITTYIVYHYASVDITHSST